MIYNLNTSRLNELLINLQEITDLKFSLHDLKAHELYTVNKRSAFATSSVTLKTDIVIVTAPICKLSINWKENLLINIDVMPD